MRTDTNAVAAEHKAAIAATDAGKNPESTFDPLTSDKAQPA